MEIIYKTFDGKIFDNETDACFHESVVLEGIKMWNRDGREVNQTSGAFVLYLENETANCGFFALARAQNDSDIRGITEGEDYGLFYWDELTNEYRWLDNEELSVIMIAANYLESKKEKSEANHLVTTKEVKIMKYRDPVTKVEYTEEEFEHKMADCIGECELWSTMELYGFDEIWYNLTEEFRQKIWNDTLEFYKNRYYEVIEEGK